MKNLIISLILINSFNVFSQEVNEKYCNKIITKTDKFTGETTRQTPHKPGFIDPLFYTKVGERTVIYLKSYGSTPNVGKKGAILLLKDGNKIERPETKVDINVNTGGPGYLMTTMFTLKEDEITLLMNSPVSSVRLYIYDIDFNEKQQLKQMEYLKCLQAL